MQKGGTEHEGQGERETVDLHHLISNVRLYGDFFVNVRNPATYENERK